MERFDIVDENGNPTGKTIERKEAHRIGAAHRTSHVWIFRKHEGKIQVLLQKRCESKDSFPGCYDISSAGHIPAGYDYIESAVRELKEELDVDIDGSELLDCGLFKLKVKENFYGEEFLDNQISKVFILWLDKEADEFTVQEEEIESVMWMNFDDCKEAIKNNAIPHCIKLEELDILEKYI